MIKRFLWLTAPLLLSTVSIQALLPLQAQAITGAEWQAGRIIDDSVFTNKDSMTPSEIQQFLNAKMTNCDTNGTKLTNGITRAQYGANNGNPAPFTCLKDYYEVPKTSPSPGVPANNYGYADPLNNIPSGARSAAQLIWDAAQQYSISPKVLLITLQKEQSLVTDDWPFERQYLYAMGAQCPDTSDGANCDTNYSGFSLQVREGARLLRGYLDNMTKPWWTYKKPYANNQILWNVTSTGCGGANVYIETMATAALYTYTPYQPNQAALNNLYGTGDACSAYGNRNFWRLFNDWFGTTKGDLFQASLVSQNQSISASAGQSSTATLTYRNTGQWTWHDDTVDWPGIPPLRLATANPTARSSIFSYGWHNNYSPNVAAKVYESDGTTLAANQHIISPGQVISYTFPMTAPWSLGIGSYAEQFKPILAGSSIDLGGSALATVTVDVPPVFRATNAGQSDWPSLVPGESVDLLIKYRNTGQYAWRDDTVNWPGLPPLYLYSANRNGVSTFSYSWPTRSIAAKTFNKVYESNGTFNPSSNQHIVEPGQIAEFKVTISAPWSIGVGKHIEYFKPALAGSGVDLGAVTGYEVDVPAWRAKLVQPTPDIGLAKGNSAWVCVQYRNKGAYTWHDSTVSWPGVPAIGIATANSNNQSIFSYLWSDTSSVKRIATDVIDSVYTENGTLISPNPHVVLPNQVAKFCFIQTTPWGANSNYNYVDYVKPALLNSGVVLTSATDYANVRIHVP